MHSVFMCFVHLNKGVNEMLLLRVEAGGLFERDEGGRS